MESGRMKTLLSGEERRTTISGPNYTVFSWFFLSRIIVSYLYTTILGICKYSDKYYYFEDTVYCEVNKYHILLISYTTTTTTTFTSAATTTNNDNTMISYNITSNMLINNVNFNICFYFFIYLFLSDLYAPYTSYTHTTNLSCLSLPTAHFSPLVFHQPAED